MNYDIDHKILHKYTDKTTSLTFNDMLVSKYFLYFSLYGNPDIVHKFGCRFGIFNNIYGKDDPNLRLCESYIFSSKFNLKYKNLAIYFFEAIVKSVQYFDFSNSSDKEIGICLSDIVNQALINDKIYSLEDKAIEVYIFSPKDYARNRTIKSAETYYINYTDESKSYIYIEGFDGRIPIKKFVKAPKRTQKSLFERYLSFYNNVSNTIKPKIGRYCCICNPNGLRPAKNGKETFNQHCKGCKKVFDEIAKIFSDTEHKKSIKRIKDNVGKAQGISVHEFKSNRIETFRKSLSREIKKLKREAPKKYRMLRNRNILTSKSLKNIATMMQERFK